MAKRRPLLPTRSRILPGALYLHDLALIDGALHANAVGENAGHSELEESSRFNEVWWPRCIERDSAPSLDEITYN